MFLTKAINTVGIIGFEWGIVYNILRRDLVTDFKTARKRMVDFQIEARGIRDDLVLSAMRAIPRHKFIPDGSLAGAYEGARSVDGMRLSFQGLEGEGRLTAVDTSTRSRMTGVEISGYLGLEVLRNGRLVIDTRHQRIRVDR